MATEYTSRVHPKKFALWMGLGSIVMMFSGLTSAYIVRRAAGDWTQFKIPEVFTYSTVAVVLSSLTLIIAYICAKKEKIGAYRIGLVLTFILGLVFTFLQFKGWNTLEEYGIHLTGNPSGSFIYLISGIHLAHLVGGLLLLFGYLIKSFYRKDPVDDLIEKTIDPERFLGIELVSTYWHFVGILWIYLFFFFNYYR